VREIINKMTIIDLYSDLYLGDSETILIERNSSNEVIFKVRLSTASFNGILSWIPFNENSNPQSMVYINNMNFSFGERDFELVERLQEFYNQLIDITSQVHSLDLPILNALKQISQSTLQNGNKLFVKFE
jgi:hypothetical protein